MISADRAETMIVAFRETIWLGVDCGISDIRINSIPSDLKNNRSEFQKDTTIKNISLSHTPP